LFSVFASTYLHAASDSDAHTYKSQMGELFCSSKQYIDCLGITKDACVNIYSDAASGCIKKYPLDIEMDRTQTSERAKQYGNCTTKELKRKLVKHESCGQYLEPVFEKYRSNSLKHREDNLRKMKALNKIYVGEKQ